MNKKEYALSLFEGNLNCAQSVLSAFSQEINLDIINLQKIGSNFGGGMAEGGICGAATAAFMILGIKFGTDQTYNAKQKANNDEMLARYKAQFINRFGSLNCKDLIGYDIKIPDEQKMAIEKEVFKSKCPLFVSGSVEVIESMIGSVQKSGE